MQQSMTNAFTLFPDFLALVPLEAIAGDSASITNFSEITKENSFIINDSSADTDLTLNQNGVEITYTKTSSAVQGFDAGGLGDIDDVTIQRALTISLGVNGFSHDILAILVGLDPAEDVETNFKFLKDDEVGVSAAGVRMQGAIIKKKFLFVARIPLADSADGDLYVVSPKVVVEDQDIQHLMQNSNVTHNIPLKGLKMLNTAELSKIQSIFEPVVNGFELLFMFNAGDTAYTE